MGFELFCATMIALLFGLAVTFGGYRVFRFLLPVWAFFFGFGLGAQSMQMLFGSAFLADVTSWVVGFILGAIFAVLSWVIYMVGVALLAGSIGYAVGVAVMLWIGFQAGLITWLVGIVLAAALVVVTLVFNLQKYVIVIGSAILGAGLIIGTLMLGAVGVTLTKLLENPISVVLNDNPLWTLLFLALAGAGAYVQLKTEPAEEFTGSMTF